MVYNCFHKMPLNTHAGLENKAIAEIRSIKGEPFKNAGKDGEGIT